MFETAAEWHAALNDFPPALFLVSVIFDLVGSATKREPLKTVAFWTLVAAAVGAVAALSSGLLAEGSIEHGGAVHEVMERHELFAKITTVGIVLLAGWRMFRRGALPGIERTVYLGAAVVGVAMVTYVAHLGGTIVFRHGGGVPTSVLESAIAERAAGHEHGEGEEHSHDEAEQGEGEGEGEVDAAGSGAQPSPEDTGHAHAPGTPAHQH